MDTFRTCSRVPQLPACTRYHASVLPHSRPSRKTASLGKRRCHASKSDDAPSEKDNSSGVVTSGNVKQRPSMRLEKVERLGEESWAGVAAVDRGRVDRTSFGRAAILAGGDAAAVLIFATVGRGSHAELDGIAGVLVTAWPFLAGRPVRMFDGSLAVHLGNRGWFTGAVTTGAYGAASQYGTTREAATAAGKAWCIAIVVSLLLRSIAKGAPPPIPFAVVASVATSVLLIGWRSAFAALMPQPQASGRKVGNGNKSGNPFEFLQLLGSLTKRW